MEQLTISKPKIMGITAGFVAVIVSLMLFQLIKLPWILNQAILWSDFEMEKHWYVLIPFILALLICEFITKTTIRYRIQKLLTVRFMVIIVIFQIIVELGLYLTIHRLLGLSNPILPSSANLASGWLSNEILPMILITIWLFITLNILLPCFFLVFIGSAIQITSHKMGLYWGLVIFSAIMTVRGIAGLHPLFFQIICSLAWIPMLLKAGQSDQISITNQEVGNEFAPNKDGSAPDQSSTINSSPIINTNIGITEELIFLIGIWFLIMDFQSPNSLDLAYLWLVPLAGCLILIQLNKGKNTATSSNGILSTIGVLIYVVALIALILLVLGGIYSDLYQLRPILLGLVLLVIIIVPELIFANFGGKSYIYRIRNKLVAKKPIMEKLFLSWPSILLIYFLFGMLMPLIIIIGEPYTIYAGLFFIVWAGILGLKHLH